MKAYCLLNDILYWVQGEYLKMIGVAYEGQITQYYASKENKTRMNEYMPHQNDVTLSEDHIFVGEHRFLVVLRIPL